MVIIAIAGLFVKEPSFTCDFSKINAADVAWLITATIFVLMMTPGLSFFYGGMVGAKKRYLHHAAELYCNGTDKRIVGSVRI